MLNNLNNITFMNLLISLVDLFPDEISKNSTEIFEALYLHMKGYSKLLYESNEIMNLMSYFKEEIRNPIVLKQIVISATKYTKENHIGNFQVVK